VISYFQVSDAMIHPIHRLVCFLYFIHTIMFMAVFVFLHQWT